jgi:hypothetical protein
MKIDSNLREVLIVWQVVQQKFLVISSLLGTNTSVSSICAHPAGIQ